MPMLTETSLGSWNGRTYARIGLDDDLSDPMAVEQMWVHYCDHAFPSVVPRAPSVVPRQGRPRLRLSLAIGSHLDGVHEQVERDIELVFLVHLGQVRRDRGDVGVLGRGQGEIFAAPGVAVPGHGFCG